MSDDFDREAERRKLEEKFGREEEDRERTERLSELLLKGATMTDIHCPECGDPIFRHEGRQFCPSCQREVAGGEGQQATAGQAAAQDPTDTDPAATDPTRDGHSVEVETPDDATDRTAETVTDDGDEASPAGTEQPTTEAPDEDTLQQPSGAAPSQSGPSTSTGDSPAGTGSAPPSPAPSGTSGGASGLLPARQHLTRTVNRLAEQAAAEEDPGRKREFLAATREAAEALAAVREAE